MDQWNPSQYEKFRDERSRPFWDLAAKVNFEGVRTMIDVGCGTGELTQALHKQRGLSETVGFDSSAKMLEEAKRHLAPGLRFELGEIETYFPSKPYDLLFSNAALQWAGDHARLFPRLVDWIRAGGALAVQMPMNFDHPSHKIAEQIAPKFGLQPRKIPMLTLEEYGTLLWNLGLTEIDAFVKVYLHPMNSGHDVVEWTKGTLLTHYQRQLSPTKYSEFLQQYSGELLKVIGEGEYLYPFKRVFLVARKNHSVRTE